VTRLQVVVFSKNRPLQLHGYLTSFYQNCATEASVTVICRSEPEWFAKAYLEVADEFPQVHWRQEQVFAEDVAKSLDPDVPYTMFGCDDVVFTRQFEPDGALWTVDLIGLSLRLGSHVMLDMFGNPMPAPAFALDGTWNVEDGATDWGYPWEVLGTIYQTDFVRRMVARINPHSPSELEARGALCWRSETDARRMLSWGRSRLVVPTVNLVQSEYPNGIAGKIPLEPGFLLECWDMGLRMDTVRYSHMSPASWRVPDFWLRRL